MPTIDATKGGESANAYATVEEADEFWDGFYSSEWEEIDSDDKARLLITATRMIDGLSLLYSSAATSQALNFPLATNDESDDGFEQARKACITQAYYLFKNLDVVQEGVTMGIQGVKSETIGPTSKQITGFNPFRKFDPEVYRYLAPYIDMDFMASRG